MVNLIVGWNVFILVKKTCKFSSPCGQAAKMSARYLQQVVGFCVVVVKVMLKLAHKDICIGWDQTGSYRSSLFLQTMQSVEGEIIPLVYNQCQIDNFFSQRIQNFLFIQYLPTCVQSFLM